MNDTQGTDTQVDAHATEPVYSNTLALENRINQWGLDRNITAEGGATVMSQMSKMTEEFAEFLQTWNEYDEGKLRYRYLAALADAGILEKADAEEMAELGATAVELEIQLQDDFGDMLVCLINAMRLAGTDMETCLAKAWDDIKDRKGRMEGGKFVKENS